MSHKLSKLMNVGGVPGNGKYVPKHMRVKKVITLCSVIASVFLAFVFSVYGGNANAAQADEQGAGNTTKIESVTMRWSGVPDGTDAMGTYVQAPNTYPNTDEPVSFKATFDYALSGSVDHSPGTVTIRIPAHIFKDRDGSRWEDTVSLSVPEDSKYPGRTDYSYAYDEENDQIVLTNRKTVSASSKALFDVTYTVVDISKVADMEPSKGLSALMSIRDSDDEPAIEKTSNAVYGELNTFARLVRIDKKGVEEYDSYPSSGWGAAPTDASDYVYVVWNMFVAKDANTQPCDITVTDQPATDGLEVLGYRCTGKDYLDYKLAFNPQGDFTPTATLTIQDDEFHSDNFQYGYQVSVLTRYPKAKLINGSAVLRNDAMASALGVDRKDAASEVSTKVESTTSTGTATYTYTGRDSFAVPDPSTHGSKGSSADSPGGIEAIKDGRAAAFNGNFQNYADVQGYRYTLADDGDPTKQDDYGKKTYTVQLVDEDFSLGASGKEERLSTGDYEIAEVTLSTRFFDYVLPSGGTEYVAKENEDYDAHPSATLWGKFNGSDEWVELGSYWWKVDGGTYHSFFKDTGGTESDAWSNDYRYTLASGCVAVKMTCDSSYYETKMELDVNPRLLPSTHVKSILSDADTGYLVDRNETTTWDSTGDKVGGPDGSRATATISSFKRTSYARKGLVDFSNDENNQRIALTYRAEYGEMMRHPTTGGDDGVADEDGYLVSRGYFTPQASATFYDLLPQGVEPDLSSVVVRDSCKGREDYFDNEDKYIDDHASYTTEVKANWRGSGRNLFVVHVTPSDPSVNYSGITNRIYSSISIEFRAYYSWDDYADFGGSLENDVAIQSGNDMVVAGQPDDAEEWSPIRLESDSQGSVDASTKKLLSGLGDGSGAKQFLYARSVDKIDANVHASMNLSKSVRGPGNQEWSNGQDGSVIVSAGDEYQYRLRMGSELGSSTSGIVFYDSLESYVPDDEGARWHGTLQGVDTQQLERRGVKPVVYYSTIADLDLSKALNRDLSNTSVWTSLKPSDFSKVTAVAIDCRTAADGKPFSLGQGQTLAATIDMKAPSGDDYASAYKASANAYNQVWATDVLYNLAGEKTDDKVIHQEYTQVGVRRATHYMPTTGSPGRALLELVGLGLLVATTVVLHRLSHKEKVSR